ncbi:MAG: ATPase [Peptococcaceae bacterium BICA1-7]|nr:MAG: ATPase [Peptococcaceae bacterium BICA1-7]HBV96813.1 MoxR family ATPase [Desulfotomaculum sp.]
MLNYLDSPDKVSRLLLKQNYLADRKLAMTVFLAARMKKPLLVEGPSGVGKTYLARALAGAINSGLVRLQCYPGLDESKSLYEWNYQKQLLFLQTAREGISWSEAQKDIYSEEFLLARPVLKAFMSPEPMVLLIDEIDKSDEELESFLLEALSEFQISIPELGTIKSRHIPMVIITSNSARDFSDALKRRCLHLYIPYPDREKEEAIIRMHLGGISQALSGQVAEFLSRVRKMALRKLPGISEATDWARALLALGATGLDRETVQCTINVLLKYEEDVASLEARIEELIPIIDQRSDEALKGEVSSAEKKRGIPARFDF